MSLEFDPDECNDNAMIMSKGQSMALWQCKGCHQVPICNCCKRHHQEARFVHLVVKLVFNTSFAILCLNSAAVEITGDRKSKSILPLAMILRMEIHASTLTPWISLSDYFDLFSFLRMDIAC